jgi:hypothetical protein
MLVITGFSDAYWVTGQLSVKLLSAFALMVGCALAKGPYPYELVGKSNLSCADLFMGIGIPLGIRVNSPWIPSSQFWLDRISTVKKLGGSGE